MVHCVPILVCFEGILILDTLHIYIYIYIDIVPDVLDTSGESKNNIGPPEGGPKTVYKTHCWPISQRVVISTYVLIGEGFLLYLW
jgi:hypothetical protein